MPAACARAPPSAPPAPARSPDSHCAHASRLPLRAQALAHDKAEHGGSGERKVDGDGRSPCLWDGCTRKPVPVVRPSAPGQVKLNNLRRHEACHEKGAPTRGYVCPRPGCNKAFGKDVDAAWACCAQAHGIARDLKRCLWELCPTKHFATPSDYKKHEPVRISHRTPQRHGPHIPNLSAPYHCPLPPPPTSTAQAHTGKFLFSCPTCGKGAIISGAHLRCTAPRLPLRPCSPPSSLILRRATAQRGRATAA